jgi:hypothetical protein
MLEFTRKINSATASTNSFPFREYSIPFHIPSQTFAKSATKVVTSAIAAVVWISFDTITSINVALTTDLKVDTATNSSTLSASQYHSQFINAHRSNYITYRTAAPNSLHGTGAKLLTRL